jgi:YD repeat-containing protein
MTNLGGYQLPILQSRPPSLSTPNAILVPNPQTLAEGSPVGLVNTRAGNLTFKIRLYPDLDLVYDSRHSLFMGDEVITLHKNAKTADLRTADGYTLAYVRDKAPGSENGDGQRYLRVVDGPDDYGPMWVKAYTIMVERRSAGSRKYIEDKRLKETGTEKFFVLQSVESPTGATRYAFDDEGNMTLILPEQGPAVAFAYNGNAISIGLEGEEPGYGLTVNDHGNPLALTMNMEIAGYHGSEPIHNLSYALTYHFVYSPAGQLLNVTDSISRTHLAATYGVDGRVATLTLPGQRWSYTYAGGTTTIQFSGEEDLRALQPLYQQTFSYQIQTNHETTVTVTDAMGYIEIKTYSPAGDLARYQDKNGHLYQYTYNTQHKMLTATEPLNQTWTWQYDPYGYRTYQRDPRGAETRYFYDTSHRLIRLQNALGFETTYTYDPFDNIKTITDPGNHTTAYTYFYDLGPTPIGQQVKMMAKITTDAMGYQTREDYAYDALTGQKLTAKRTRPNGGEWTYTYQHADGEVKAKEAMDPFGAILSGQYEPIPCGGAYMTQYAYRRDARCDDCPEANDHRFWMGKDPATGLILKTRDQDHYEVHYTYQAIGSRWVLKEFQRFDQANDAWTTLSCGLTVPNWTRPSPEESVSVTAYEYNLRGELTKEIDPLGRETIYTYDGNGNMTTKTFPNGRGNTYHYDALNRLTAIDYPDGSHDYFAYDAAGNLTESNGVDATLLYQYDLLSRITTATQVYDDREEMITYQYNGDNLRTMMVWGDKSWVTQYDANHRTQHLTNPYGETTSFTYASCCTAVQDVIHANGARIHYDYDQAERITDVLNLKPDQSILKSFHYERDANGMVTEVEREDPYWNQAYLYDNRLQLQGASYGMPEWMNEVYTYDGRGNRQEKWVDGVVAETYGYNLADEIQSRNLSSGISESYEYQYQDANEILMTFSKRWSDLLSYRNGEIQSFDYREKMARFTRNMNSDWIQGGFTSRMETDFAYLPDGMGRVGKRSYAYSEWESSGPHGGWTQTRETTKDSFFLNDFYNMLDEEIRTVSRVNGGPPDIDFSRKVYTMGSSLKAALSFYQDIASSFSYFDAYGSIIGSLKSPSDEFGSTEYSPTGNELNEDIAPLYFKGMQYDQDMGLYTTKSILYNPLTGAIDPFSRRILNAFELSTRTRGTNQNLMMPDSGEGSSGGSGSGSNGNDGSRYIGDPVTLIVIAACAILVAMQTSCRDDNQGEDGNNFNTSTGLKIPCTTASNCKKAGPLECSACCQHCFVEQAVLDRCNFYCSEL